MNKRLEQNRSGARRACLGACALLVASLLACSAHALDLPFPSTAFADDTTYAAPNELGSKQPKTDIEVASDAFKQARSKVLSINVQAAATQTRIDYLEARMPALQERSDAAMREMYKMQGQRDDIVEALLSSQSLDAFFKQADYLDRIGRANARRINDLRDAQARLDAARAKLDSQHSEADAVMQEAADALDAIKAQRVAKQSEAVANAQSQATSLGGEASVGKDGDGNDQPKEYREAASTETAPLDDGADWTMSEEQFIATWAPRIDAYLAGSPLEGQGVNFARSSWRYCVDPRWSPAISNTESSKGAYCIRPHNAWGWGAADSDPYNLASEWKSWEEAIDAHVKGLANGYGYTISIGGARMYCPYTWQSWYNNTLSQMAQI